MARNPKMVKCRNCGTVIESNIRICPACGAKNKKPFYKRGWFLLIVVFVLIGGINTINRKKEERAERSNEYRWSDSELAGMIPEPESKYGRVSSESEQSFTIDVYQVSQDQFEDYVDACKECGFTVDYSRYGSSYSAENEAGCSLSLHYDDNEKEMRISLYAPKEQENLDEEKESSDLQEDSQEPDSSEENSMDSQESDTESRAETEESVSAQEQTSGELVDGMHLEFKEAMDSYEAFYDEYCELMKQVAEDASNMTVLTKYMEFLSKMEEVDEKFEAWEDGDMNDAEMKYYLEVHNRILQKMMEISAE